MSEVIYLGDCPCGSLIDSRDGVRIDADGQRWHPDCRREELAQQRVQAQAVKAERRGPGRPPKAPVTPAAA